MAAGRVLFGSGEAAIRADRLVAAWARHTLVLRECYSLRVQPRPMPHIQDIGDFSIERRSADVTARPPSVEV